MAAEGRRRGWRGVGKERRETQESNYKYLSGGKIEVKEGKRR